MVLGQQLLLSRDSKDRQGAVIVDDPRLAIGDQRAAIARCE